MARILYLDDDQELVDYMGKVFPEHEVVGTTDPEEALRKVRESVSKPGGQFDVLLLETFNTVPPSMTNEETDFGRKTGIRVAEQARVLDPDLPSVFFTHARFPDLRNAMHEAGCVSVITKPAEVIVLRTLVQRAISRR